MNHRSPYNQRGSRRLIGISLLPSTATLGNLLSGVVAMVCCLLAVEHTAPPFPPGTALSQFFPTYVAGGAYFVVLALIFDALDGRLARLTRRTSEFGAQLDSIADIVSFGVAPALLFFTLLMNTAGAGNAAVPGILWKFGLLAMVVYLCCAAIRLARYNAENIRDELGKRYFSGLPVPGGALGAVALLILHEDIAPQTAWLGVDVEPALRWITPAALVGLGLLMVSRISYVHVFNVYVRRRHPPIHLIGLVAAAVIAWFSPQILLVALALLYIASGPLLGRPRQVAEHRSKARRSAAKADDRLADPAGTRPPASRLD